MGKLYLSGIVPEVTEPVNLIGTIWLFTEDGTFNVPQTGTYQVEMHGGGGGGSYLKSSNAVVGGAGGGSGEIYTVELTKGQIINVTIGEGCIGGNYAKADTVFGGTTTFGSLSVEGGGNGSGSTAEGGAGGSASGRIATDGEHLRYVNIAGETGTLGGYGNANIPEQTYGNGGNGGYDRNSVKDGQPGAVIVTFMGVS